MNVYEAFNGQFKEVKTPKEMARFEREWKKICKEKGAKFYAYHPNSTRFFIMNGKEIVGTIEFTKRDPEVFSVCEDYFPFEQHKKVSKNHQEVFEIGKISIQKKHRKNGHVDKILLLLQLFAEVNQVKQFIGFINIELHRLLLLGYSVRLERLSEEVKSDTHTSVAILCDVEKTKKILIKKNIIKPFLLQKN